MLPSMSGQLYQPGWYPDPSGRFEFRFHNGSLWTADVSTNGQRYVDPLGAAPSRHREQAFTSQPSAQRPGAGLDDPRHRRRVDRLDAVHRGVGAVCAFLALLFGVIALARGHRAARGDGPAGASPSPGSSPAASLRLLCVVGVVFSFAARPRRRPVRQPGRERGHRDLVRARGSERHVRRRDREPRRRRGRLHRADRVHPAGDRTTRIAPHERSSTTWRPASPPSSNSPGRSASTTSTASSPM